MQFLEFIKSNYQLIFTGLLLIVEIVLLLVKKKPIEPMKQLILSNLPDLIAEAEKQYTDGKLKLQYVLAGMQKLIEIHLGKESHEYDKFIIASTEEILKTPQKKEKL